MKTVLQIMPKPLAAALFSISTNSSLDWAYILLAFVLPWLLLPEPWFIVIIAMLMGGAAFFLIVVCILGMVRDIKQIWNARKQSPGFKPGNLAH